MNVNRFLHLQVSHKWFHTTRQIFNQIQHRIQVTPRAAQQLAKINSNRPIKQVLKVQVDAGGCHGYQYTMKLVDAPEKDDIIFKNDESSVAVDPLTLDMIQGSKIEYVDELIGSSFQVIDNPQSESSCGCKISFNIKN